MAILQKPRQGRSATAAVTPETPPTRAPALVASITAALASGVGMLLMRSTLQVRTVPERLMEWLLLFVSPQQFESALQRFGLDAKRYALTLATLIMLASLSGLGYAALRRGWSIRAIGALGVGLWLVVMLIIMPLTAGGPFAVDLLDGKRAAIGGYLAVGLTFSAVLAIARMYLPAVVALAHPQAPPDPQTRREALGLLGAGVAVYAATFLGAGLLPKRNGVASVILEDPQEPVPSGGIDPPNPHPNVVPTPAADPQATSSKSASTNQPPDVSAAQPAATPNGDALPQPVSSRTLVRDKDGAVLPTARRPGELAPAITSNTEFYVVTKNAGGDPSIHPDEWRLLIDGDVERSFQLDYATLRKMPRVEVTKTLECISNFVGKPELAPFGAELISTAVWAGVRVRDILGLVGGPRSDAAWLAVLSADEFTSALPLEAAMDPNTLLVYEMNGAVLPREHGYPARLLVPGRYGMKNAKWVVGLRPMRREFTDWYGLRNWSKEGVVQAMTRIDTPANSAELAPGSQPIAGVAYAGTRGIQKVEYSADGGDTWKTADMLEPVNDEDRWVRWRGTFAVAAGGGSYTLVARATDGSGEVQKEAFSLPEPAGGTGLPSIEVRAST